MRKAVYCILFISSLAQAMPIDTNVFKYFPIQIGNRWTWYRTTNVSPGPGFESLKMLSTQTFNGRIYFVSKYDVYRTDGTLYYTTNMYYRMDSLTGNLKIYDTQNQTECLSDSMNSARNDSAFCCTFGWYRYDTSSYYIFNQNFQAKLFQWSNYFEGGGLRKYARNIGRVYERNQYVMNYTQWNLRGCLINGTLYGDTGIVGIIQINSEVPEFFSLSQNYPNPFNPITRVKFALPKTSFVKLAIYDMLGTEVTTLVNESLKPGTYEVDWNASNYPSGVYYYKLVADEFVETKKMVLIK
jgi:type IX secretion system substrate protein